MTPNVTRSQRGAKPSTLPCSVSGAHIDWMTCTASRKGRGEALWAHGDTFLRALNPVDEPITRWQFKGYRGWSGGDLRLGARQDSVILVVSGLKSTEKWSEYLSTAENCSRLDIAVDADFTPVNPSLASQLYRQVIHRRPRNGRPPKSSVIFNSDGGSTLYVGSRSSDLLLRIYDKGRETDTRPAGAWWRFELEVKGDTALPVARQLQPVASDPHSLASIVNGHAERVVGVLLPSIQRGAICNRTPDEPTTARQLRWLSSSVRPTVQDLVERVGAQTVLTALGFLTSAVENSPSIQPSTRGDYASRRGVVSGNVEPAICGAER